MQGCLGTLQSFHSNPNNILGISEGLLGVSPSRKYCKTYRDLMTLGIIIDCKEFATQDYHLTIVMLIVTSSVSSLMVTQFQSASALIVSFRVHFNHHPP